MGQGTVQFPHIAEGDRLGGLLPLAPARDLRLVERVELTVLTPTAVRSDAPEPRPRETDQPVVLSCSNPAGDLTDWAPVPGRVTLAGTKADPVPWRPSSMR